MKLKKTFGVLMLSSSLALAGCAGTGSSSSSLDSGDDAKFFSLWLHVINCKSKSG